MEYFCVTTTNKPVVDLSECTLCGICTDVYPDIFTMNDAGFVDVVECDDYPEEDVLDAIKNCPADCIYQE